MKNRSKSEYVIDKYYNFERPKGYVPPKHLTTEDEIRELCKKNRIAVQEIVKYDGFRVLGTKVRSHKECKELQAVLSATDTKRIGGGTHRPETNLTPR